jgi:hypothetical protein
MKKMSNLLVLTIIILLSMGAQAENQENKIEFKSIFTEIPSTALSGLKLGFSKESLPWWGGNY